MRYGSSEAYSLDGYDRRHEGRQASARPSFDVYEGGGLDARVRQGVTPQFLAWIRRAALVGALIVAMGFVRVALSTATVSALNANEQLETQIDDATALYNDLKVSKSTLSSASRIERIASQNYGMVLADPEVISASGSGSDEDSSQADAASDPAFEASADAADSSNVD